MDGVSEVQIGPFGIEITKDIEDYPWFWKFQSEGRRNLIVSGQEFSEYEARKKLLLAIIDYVESIRKDTADELVMSQYLCDMMSAFAALNEDNRNTMNVDNNIEMNFGNCHALYWKNHLLLNR